MPADSTLVFPPGWRVLDGNGNVAPGAKITFYVETTTPDPAFSDAALSTELPNPVVCDSGGYPTSDGNAKVLIWRGTQTYRVKITAADGTVIDDKDGIPGALPFTSLQAQVSSREIAEIIPYGGISVPSNRWLPLNAKTIGSASSNASARASDSSDTLALFTTLWNADTGNQLPILTSAGGASTKGASAGADFIANKRLTLPDGPGRTLAGADNMGGIVSVNRLTGQSAGVNGDVNFAGGGAETDTLSEAKLPVIDPDSKKTDLGHLHTSNDANNKNSAAGTDNSVFSNPWYGGTKQSNTSSATTGITFSNIGSGEAHNNVQPTLIIPMFMIYAGVP